MNIYIGVTLKHYLYHIRFICDVIYNETSISTKKTKSLSEVTHVLFTNP